MARVSFSFLCFTCALAVGAILFGCGALFHPNVSFMSVNPPLYYLGQDPDIAVIGIEGGRRNEQDALIESLVRSSRASGFFVIKDRRSEGIEFNIQDGAPVSVGKEVKMNPNTIFVQMEIIETSTEDDTEEVMKIPETKEELPSMEEVKVRKGEAVVMYTVLSQGKVFMNEKEYEGRVKVERDDNTPSKGEMKERALQASIEAFLPDITPANVEHTIWLDKDDESQKPILTQATKGNIAVAKQQLEEYIKSNPGNAAAIFNLAALSDAMGEYEAALELYKQAVSRSGKSRYQTVLSECMKRLNAKNELEGK